MLRGALGFAVISTGAFAVWAFGAPWFHDHGGELVMYAACLAVFILGSALLLPSLLGWTGRRRRFHAVFFAAFLAYAVAWCAGWFWLGLDAGEWAGSLAGTAAFSAMMAAMLNRWRLWLQSTLVLFVMHSLGYFAGRYICDISHHSVGSELAWGCLYGLGFGAGIGYIFAVMRHSPWTPESS